MSYRESRTYYDVSGVSAEDVIDGLNMLHREGAATKYLFRCNKIQPKGSILEDLKKCRHYLNRCLIYDPGAPRDYTAEYWLGQINPDVFDIDIYIALTLIINAVGAFDANYKANIESAIELISDVIEKY